MANISTASGYAVFSAQNPETLKLLTQAADTMKDNFSYPTDFKWADAHSNRARTRQRVFSSGSDAGTSQTSFTPSPPTSQTRTFPS